MADRLYVTGHFTDLYFSCRICDSWQVLNFTYFCSSLIADLTSPNFTISIP